jgi:lysophospholipase L1-like esterase
MFKSIIWLPVLMMLLILPVLGVSATGTGSRTMDYAWLLFLKTNEPPQVDAGEDQQITGNSATLDGVVIDDSGDALSYSWSQDSGPGLVMFDDDLSKQTTVTFTASGTYVLYFSASDGEFDSSDSVVITVVNTAPQVYAGKDAKITHPTNSFNSVALLHSTVTDDQNNVTSYEWSKVSGPGNVVFDPSTGVNSNVRIYPGAVGKYELRLTARDWEYTSTDTVIIDYLPQSPPPVEKIDVVVTVGDSITNGTGDSDCIFQQADTSCTGYQRPLKDKLKGTTKYASNLAIHDEAKGGKASGWGRNEIDAITSRYPQADQYLIMFGTNDANVNPPLSQSTFKSNMQYMINVVKSKGAKPALAKAPYAKGAQTYRNTWIQQYNQAVDQLVSSNSIDVSPPDFYSWFQGHQSEIHSTDMFRGTPDNLHPNHTGYQSMVNIWYGKLR